MKNCGRCFALKGRIRKGTIRVIGPYSIEDYVCQTCYDEITMETDVIYVTSENKEDEGAYKQTG